MAAAEEQLPGAEFLLRRLVRATAIPAADRPPDVAAFVESVQLLREACDLLPLTADGRAALAVDSPAARQQVLLAFLKAARARYVSPCDPVCDRNHEQHLHTYCLAWVSCSRPSRYSSDDDQAALESLVHLMVTSWLLTASDAAFHASKIVLGLADEELRHATSRALQQLAAAAGQDQPLLSVDQLRYLCCWDAVQAADVLRLRLVIQSTAAPRGITVPAAYTVEVPPPAELAAVLEGGQTCAALLLQLEPHSPKSYLALALTAGWAGQSDHAVRLSLQALQLARQQRNDWALLNSVHSAVRWAGTAGSLAPASSRRSDMAAAAAAAVHPEVEQALASCRRLLPRLWVDEVDLTATTAHLRSLQAALSGQPEQRSVMTVAEVQQQVEDMGRNSECDGCGQTAVGLRLCSRCKKARYCSTGCQRTHWRAHKRECQPVRGATNASQG